MEPEHALNLPVQHRDLIPSRLLIRGYVEALSLLGVGGRTALYDDVPWNVIELVFTSVPGLLRPLVPRITGWSGLAAPSGFTLCASE